VAKGLYSLSSDFSSSKLVFKVYLGEGRIFPSFLMSQWVLQLRVSLPTLRGILHVIYLLLVIFRWLVDSYGSPHFGAEDVRCLSLLLSTISHFIGDGQCISCALLYYVDSLIQRP
jgi:hypothetical protein